MDAELHGHSLYVDALHSKGHGRRFRMVTPKSGGDPMSIAFSVESMTGEVLDAVTSHGRLLHKTATAVFRYRLAFQESE